MNVKACDYHLARGELKIMSKWVNYGFNGRVVRKLHLCGQCARVCRVKTHEEQLAIVQAAENELNTNPKYGLHAMSTHG